MIFSFRENLLKKEKKQRQQQPLWQQLELAAAIVREFSYRHVSLIILHTILVESYVMELHLRIPDGDRLYTHTHMYIYIYTLALKNVQRRFKISSHTCLNIHTRTYICKRKSFRIIIGRTII